MKKKLQFLLFILMCGMLPTLSAQESSGFHVRFSAEGATCYNNGKVLYALTDSIGTVLDSLPARLSNVRVYYKRSDADSVHFAGWYYTGGTDTLTVNYGTYLVGVEALLDDGEGGYTRVDTHTVLTKPPTRSPPRRLSHTTRSCATPTRAPSPHSSAPTSVACSCASSTVASLTP